MSPIESASLPEAVSREITHFKDRVEAYRAGTFPDAEFKPFRLVHGIYGQRQKDVQMVRIKIPGGRLNAAQFRCLAGLVRDFGPLGIGHVTTRQCVQIHYVKLENVPQLMTRLEAVGLTTREACGNAIRNITCSPVAGISGDEVFNPYPYAMGVFRHFLRRPEFANLPRKFKMSFNGSLHDYSQAAINDVGFFSAVRIVDGKPVRGFKMKVGGGLGSSPQDAWDYQEFVPVDEVASHVQAILIHFNAAGERKNRMAARLKYLIRKEGYDKFLQEVAKVHATLPKVVKLDLDTEEAEPQATPGAEAPAQGPDSYADWLKFNTWTQKQKGFRYVILKLTLGDLTALQFDQLAGVIETYGNNDARNTNDQNLLIPWVRVEKLPGLYAELKKIGLADLGPDLIGDVTSCPGASTCNLGLTSSRGLGAALTEHLALHKAENADLRGTHVKISGCPNSCGQHHVGTFGFFGAVRKVNGQDSPHFNLLLGGGIDEKGAKFGRLITKIPARRIPKALDILIAAYRAERQEGETLESWTRRVDKNHVVEMLAPLTEITSGAADLFLDNGSDQPFKLEGLGASECA